MTFNRQLVEHGLNQKVSYGSGEKDPWSMFPTIKIFGGETHRGIFLTPFNELIPLWIHEWKGQDRTRTLCPKMHHGVECLICKDMKDKFGNNCRPRHMLLGLFWDYSNIGKSWTPESGPNKGVPQAVYPFGVISIPAGEERINWSRLEQANANGYGFPNSPNQSMIWEFSHVPDVGFQPPSVVPVDVLGSTPRSIDPGIVQWLQSSSENDRIAQLFATIHGVDWQAWGLVEPPKAQTQGGQQNAQQGGNNKSTRRSGRAKANEPASPGATQVQGSPQVQNFQFNQGMPQTQPQAGFTPQVGGGYVQNQNMPTTVGAQAQAFPGYNQVQPLAGQAQEAQSNFPAPFGFSPPNISQDAAQAGVQGTVPFTQTPAFGAPGNVDPTQVATERATAAFANLLGPTAQSPAVPSVQPSATPQMAPPTSQFQVPAQQPVVDDEIARLKAQLAALQQGQQPEEAEQASQRRNLVTG